MKFVARLAYTLMNIRAVSRVDNAVCDSNDAPQYTQYSITPLHYSDDLKKGYFSQKLDVLAHAGVVSSHLGKLEMVSLQSQKMMMLNHGSVRGVFLYPGDDITKYHNNDEFTIVKLPGTIYPEKGGQSACLILRNIQENRDLFSVKDLSQLNDKAVMHDILNSPSKFFKFVKNIGISTGVPEEDSDIYARIQVFRLNKFSVKDRISFLHENILPFKLDLPTESSEKITSVLQTLTPILEEALVNQQANVGTMLQSYCLPPVRFYDYGVNKGRSLVKPLSVSPLTEQLPIKNFIQALRKEDPEIADYVVNCLRFCSPSDKNKESGAFIVNYLESDGLSKCGEDIVPIFFPKKWSHSVGSTVLLLKDSNENKKIFGVSRLGDLSKNLELMSATDTFKFFEKVGIAMGKTEKEALVSALSHVTSVAQKRAFSEDDYSKFLEGTLFTERSFNAIFRSKKGKEFLSKKTNIPQDRIEKAIVHLVETQDIRAGLLQQCRKEFSVSPAYLKDNHVYEYGKWSLDFKRLFNFVGIN